MYSQGQCIAEKLIQMSRATLRGQDLFHGTTHVEGCAQTESIYSTLMPTTLIPNSQDGQL